MKPQRVKFKTQIKCPASAFLCCFYPIYRRYPCRLQWDGIFAKKKSAYGATKTGSNDHRNLTDRGGAKLKIFISLESPQESELPAKIFYDDMYRSIIEGTGEQRRKKP